MVLAQRRMPVEFFASAALVFAAALWICSTQLSGAANDVWVATGVTLDLVLLVPTLYYFLAVRKCGWPVLTTLPIFFICLFAASRIVPSEHHALLNGLHAVLPIAELGLGIALVIAVRRALVAEGPKDWLDTARATVERWTGNSVAAKVLAFELGLFRYAFTRQKVHPLDPGQFSAYQKTPLKAYLWVLMMVIAVETVALHLLLMRWSEIAAWILTLLSVYSAIWLIGDTRAIFRRPIRLDAEALRLRFGMRWSLDVPWLLVERVETGLSVKPDAEKPLEMVPLGAGANVRLKLREPVVADGPYGITRRCSEVLLYVDEPRSFVSEIEQRSA